jgi:hypothetical protein
MNSNQDIYGKALEIAFLVLGNQNMAAYMKESDFQLSITNYEPLALQIARHIIDASAKIHT